jgi:hypothetical protein
MTEADHIWQVLNLRYGSDLLAANVTLLLKDGDKAVRFVTISTPQTGSDLPTTGWRKRQIALDKKAENARELGLDYEPSKTIEMAREAGMVYREFEDEFANANTDGVDLKTIEAFAALVRAEEREACAKVCEHQPHWAACAAAIRARGQA